VFVYTPLKQVTGGTRWSGGAGALRRLSVVCRRGDLTIDAAGLFLILFVWQLPHFYSIAWLLPGGLRPRGMKMLPVVDRPTALDRPGPPPPRCGLLVSSPRSPSSPAPPGGSTSPEPCPSRLWFFARCLRFAANRNDRTAKGVLRGSLLHLVPSWPCSSSTGWCPGIWGEKRLGDLFRGNDAVLFFRILEWGIGPRLRPRLRSNTN